MNTATPLDFDLDAIFGRALERVKRPDRHAPDPDASKYGVAGTETPRPPLSHGRRKSTKRERRAKR